MLVMFCGCAAAKYAGHHPPKYMWSMLHDQVQRRIIPKMQFSTSISKRGASIGRRTQIDTFLPDYRIVRLPKFFPTMEFGSVLSWRKEEGSQLRHGEVLASIGTESTMVEMITPWPGYIAKFLVPEGAERIALGQSIAVIVAHEKDVGAFEHFTEAEDDESFEIVFPDV